MGHTDIPVINRSTKPIVLVSTGNSEIICNPLYPNNSKYVMDMASEYILNVDSSYSGLFVNGNQTDWESELSGSNPIKIYLYFYDKDTFYNYPCDSIKKNLLYKKKMLLTLDYLNQNNWVISYP
ncbi:MAG: hypothetical protein ACK53Y_20755 [bacterium]